MLKSSVVRILIIFLILGIIIEVCLRQIWGFGNMLLYDSDPAYEYIAKPNQDTQRFGHRVLSNEYSMRSLPLSSEDACIVLGFGDSVINGGSLVDQDSLATTIVERDFRSRGNEGFRFLNISAGSWGPDNCAAYLKKFGSFTAKVIVLFVSSHDAYDNMTFEPVVGVHAAYPDRQYPLAIVEVVSRYLKPRLMAKMGNPAMNDTLMINKRASHFNSGFEYFREYTNDRGIGLIVCLHAEQQELEEGKFNSQGIEIENYCKTNGIKLVTGLEIGESVEDYNDHIHLNARGQRRWANALSAVIKEYMLECI